VGNGEIVCDPPTKRQPDECRAMKVERVHQRKQIIVGAERCVGWAGAPISSGIVPNDAVSTLKALELGVPHPPVEVPTMQKNHRTPGSGSFIEE
jgi:hypothetical protein